MEYIRNDMNAYNLHIIKTDRFKTVTVSVVFRRKINKEEITMRNLLKELLINSSYNYPTERSLIIETEKLYDLKLLSSNYRIGNYAILSLRTRFLNEKYTEEGMNEESIKFLLDLIFNPRLDNDIDKCKKKIEKSIMSLNDNKVKYALFKLLEETGDDSILRDDIVDVYVVGDVSEVDIKNIFREYFKIKTYHKNEVNVIVSELSNNRKVLEYKEQDNVNQTQLVMLCNINGLTDRERRYVLPVYGEMLGGTSNSILFEAVRGKNSYAYYVNSIVKGYDNIMMIYAGIDGNNQGEVRKIIEKSLKEIGKGKFDREKFDSAKKTIITGIKASLDSPIGIINNYYAMTLVNAPEFEERIKQVESVSVEEVMAVSKKVNIYSYFVLEASDEKDSN